MRYWLNTILVFTLVFSSNLLAAKTSQQKNPAYAGFVTLPDGIQRYVDFVPAKGDKPVIILSNGLVYELSRWDVLRKELIAQGYGVVNYYMRGQFKTLRQEAQDKGTPLFFKTGLTVNNLGEEINGIIDQLKIKDKVVIVGLSYGASAAAEFVKLHPEKVKATFFMAPLVVPLDRYNPQGQWLYANLEFIKLWWGPFMGPTFYDYAYNATYRSYFNVSIIPEGIPEELKDMEGLYKEAIFHLVRATRDFDLRSYDLNTTETNSVHFLLANEEVSQAFEDQLAAFEKIAPKARGSLIWLTEAAHAIPDAQPKQAAELIVKLLNKETRFQAAKSYKFDSHGLELWQR